MADPSRARLGSLAAVDCGQGYLRWANGDNAKVQGDIAPDARFGDLVNRHGEGRCAITLDPSDRQPGQQPYQGVVPLEAPDGGPVGDVATMLEHYMRQSEQLETRIVLAANGEAACGLLIQRLPIEGAGNLAGAEKAELDEEAFTRIAHFASTLTATELLTPGPNRLPVLMRAVLTKRLTLRGFIVSDFFAKQPEFLREATTWLKEGKITYCEDVVEGLENAPGALIGLLKGENFGKVVVRVTPESKG